MDESDAPARGQTRPGGWSSTAAIAIVLLAAAAPAWLAVTGDLAVDFHEVYVARTVEEMLDGGDLMLPTFRGEPRINKPPLSYWLVAGVDALNGADGLIAATEARFPSGVAAVVLACSALAIGCAVTDLRTAILGAVMVSGCTGFAEYAGSARPDMVHAAANAVALACMVWLFRDAEREPHARTHAGLSGLMVAALLVATLAKGPYLPLVTLASVGVWLVVSGRRRMIGKVLRPGLTLPAVIVPFLAWYGWVYLRLPADALASWSGELGERVSPEGEPWWKWFDPYYAYRTAMLVMPWVFIYPFVFFVIASKRIGRDPMVRLLWLVLVFGMLAWQVLPGRRPHYVLPLLAVLGPLMAVTIVDIGRNFIDAGRTRAWRGLGWGVLVAVAGGAVMVWAVEEPLRRPHLAELLLILGCVWAAGVLITWFVRRDTALSVPAGVALPCIVLSLVLAVHGTWWPLGREAERQLALRLIALETDTDELISVHGDWFEQEFYLHRTIPLVDQPDALALRGLAVPHFYLLTPSANWHPPEGLIARELPWTDDPRLLAQLDAHLFHVFRTPGASRLASAPAEHGTRSAD